MRLRRALLTLLTALAVVGMPWLPAAPAYALPAPAAAPCAGVWVVVDYGSDGGTSTSCASSFSTGTAALRSAGYSPQLDNGMVVRIKGIPASVNIQDHYWSYWHATVQADGTYSAWSYSGLGPSAYHPAAGNAEGWRYQSLSQGYVSPGVTPPKKVATTTAPATLVTTAAAPAATTTTAGTTRTAVTNPATTKASATATAAPSVAVSQEPGETPPSTAAATTPSADASPSDDTSPAASVDPTRTSSAASMVGAIAVILALGSGSVAVAVWRRRRGTAG